MGKKVSNHLHKYKRVNIGSKEKPYLVFRCTKPACTHYMPLHLAEGKLCECNRCEDAMILNKESMQLARPHCATCVKRKKSDNLAGINEFLQKVGG